MATDVSDILHEVDRLRAFLRLEERYRGLGPEERSVIRAGWPFRRKWRIPGFEGSWDAMVFAPLNGPDRHGLDPEARIEARLTYHSIENARTDFRDNTVDLCLCWHAALCADLDVVRLFEEAAALSESPMARMLSDYPKRKSADKSLWAMGFAEREIKNGVVFEWIGNRDDYLRLEPTELDAWGRILKS